MKELLGIKKIIYNYRTIAQKLWMLKQRVKTTPNLFEHVYYPNFLSSSSELMKARYQGFFSLWH